MLPKNGRKVTHRFMFANNYHGCTGCVVAEGETYCYQEENENNKEKKKSERIVVGKISAILFNSNEMKMSLQTAGDYITEEVYDAMCTLFNGNGTPKGAFKSKLEGGGGDSILYIGGVYVHKSH
jgi:hypothetical protein